MSGGFFRGTSADQDTRFSNKQAKLMKSQKFAPELEHLVDIAKVKMDVVKPWIANRVTELLGFEDEVLINFIYGLLDGKEVNGKEVQISLTGFMEKNTGKFMKELWMLLLSAQNNASGVPQQFLDAKEEETRKKKAEMDYIANEIQMKKEKENRELEQERLKKMEGVIEMKAKNSGLDPTSKSAHPKDEKEIGERNGMRERNRVSRSPHSAGRSPLSPRGSPSRPISKSFSNSRSYSGRKSRSVSKSPESRRRSISPEQVYHSPRRRSFTPRRRRSARGSLSPSRRRVPYSSRRSRSRSPYRSPSPIRHRFRSPYRRRSPSPFRRRSNRSPSPLRRRSPSPLRRKSPSRLRRRSPSPLRRRSPMRRRSSSMRRRSPSPIKRRYQRSPSTPRRSSRSPMRRRPPIHGHGRSPIPSQHRSPSPDELSSPSPIRRRSPSPARRKSPKFQRSPRGSSKERLRPSEKLSPMERQPSSFLRSPQRDPKKESISRGKIPILSPSSEKSPIVAESPRVARKQSPIKDRRSPLRAREGITSEARSSPPGKPREQKVRYDSPEASEEEETKHAREDGDRRSKPSQRKSLHSPSVSKKKDSPEKVYSPESLAVRSRPNEIELRRKGQEIKGTGKGVYPGTPDGQKSLRFERQHESQFTEDKKSDEKKQSHSNNSKDAHKPPKSEIMSHSVDHKKRNSTYDSGSEENYKHKASDKGKRKHKRSEREGMVSDDDDDFSSDSELEERKENKRRKREEKKLRKEEKRRRHEERRRRREERRAEKLKVKNDNVAKKGSHESDDEETVSGQKKLEIELRKKALESLKAKKGTSH